MKLINALSSIRIFFVLSILLLIAFLLGGVIPQGQSEQQYLEMFGRLGSSWVGRFRLNDVFSSFWFLTLIAAAAVNLLACTIKQWKLLKPRPGLFLSHLGVLLMFAGGLVHGLYAVRGVLELQRGVPRSEFTRFDGVAVPLPFEVELKDFQIQYWEPEKHVVHAIRDDAEQGVAGELLESVEVREGETAHFKSEAPDLKVLKFYPNFSIDDKGPMTIDQSRQNPALAVQLMDGGPASKKPSYLFANHPDFHGVGSSGGVRFVYEYRPGNIRQFESRIVVRENGEEKLEKLLSVNTPASYKGYRFYQSGYNEANPDYSSLQVSNDPSVWLIYAGFGVLMLGLTWAFRREF